MFGAPAPRRSQADIAASRRQQQMQNEEERRRRRRQTSSLNDLMPILDREQNDHLGRDFDVTDDNSFARDVQITTDPYGNRIVGNPNDLSDEQVYRINEVLDSTGRADPVAHDGEWHVPAVDMFNRLPQWRNGGGEEELQRQDAATEEFIRPHSGSIGVEQPRPQQRRSSSPRPKAQLKFAGASAASVGRSRKLPSLRCSFSTPRFPLCLRGSEDLVPPSQKFRSQRFPKSGFHIFRISYLVFIKTFGSRWFLAGFSPLGILGSPPSPPPQLRRKPLAPRSPPFASVPPSATTPVSEKGATENAAVFVRRHHAESRDGARASARTAWFVAGSRSIGVFSSGNTRGSGGCRPRSSRILGDIRGGKSATLSQCPA